ncbi:hypothetical protein OHA72_05595 [Dactylosporangium sp. NBC_01737]|uniref:hypothetical protein n=1 Tax=Dactylosporangium sp. NBC_01737 TaxID=2975959 RepID=UPI002E15E235|nr:hypothetical protein OHA72_05595 [Dactylosporangium sp. NBC_01737]
MPDSLAPDVAEHLLDLREPDGGRHAAVTALLVAAAGPALPGELAGEDSALRAFRQTYRARRRRRVGLFAVAAAAILSLGGTAYATGADHLPDPVQRTVDSLFGDGGGDDASPAPSAAPRPSAPPTGSPAGSPPVGSVAQLCRAWEAAAPIRTPRRSPARTGRRWPTPRRAPTASTTTAAACSPFRPPRPRPRPHPAGRAP